MRAPRSILLTAAALAATAIPAVAHAAPAPAPRIVNGGFAGHLSPYTVALFETGTSPASQTFCGGALLAPDGGAPSTPYVLTAAHCVEGMAPDELQVALGNTGSGSLMPGDVFAVPVRQIAVHPHWDPETNRHDVAVLALAADPGREGIQLADAEGSPADGSSAYWWNLAVTGWGISRADKVQDPYLRRALVDRWTPEACDNAYTTEDGERLFFAAEMLCAIGTDDGGDACLGDSGGPLVAGESSNGRPTHQRVLGVVSWGAGCGDPDLPTVYARLNAPGLQWFVRVFTDRDPTDDPPFWQPYGERPPTLLRTGDTLACERGTWANAGGGASYRYAIVPLDALEDAEPGAAASRAVTAQDAGREIVCAVQVRQPGAGGFGLAVSEPVAIPALPVPPAGEGDGIGPGAGGGGSGGPGGEPRGAAPGGRADGGAGGAGGGVRGGGANADARASAGSPLTLSTTRDCSSRRCRVVLRARPAKGRAVSAVRAKVARCIDARCTKRRTTTSTLRRGKDGTYVLRVTLKRGRYRVDVSSRERGGGWQAPVRRSLTIR